MSRSTLLLALAVGSLAFTALKIEGSPSDSTKPDPARVANPAVAPGKINWHPTFEAACQASVKSGKPVFLFQMLGRLDQEFC